MAKTNQQKQKATKIFMDDMPVHLLSDNELEEVVLGAVLIENTALDNLGGLFSENLFYNEKHKIIARAILDLFLRNEKIDILTISAELKNKDKLNDVGGAYAISKLTNRVASSSHLEYHVRLLQQFSLARTINDTCNLSRSKLFSGGNDVFDVYEELQNSLENALKDIAKYKVENVKDVFLDLIEKSKQALINGGSYGVPSGLHKLDEITNGWQGSDLIIVAGRPGMGKTALAISMMLYPTIRKSIPVAIFSLEMSKEQLVGRMASSVSGINASKIVKKQLTEYEIKRMEEGAIELNSAPMYIDDTPNISLVELKTKARKLVRDQGVKMIIVDYLQLMRSGLQISNREQEISEISRGLKALAKELNIPVIALSQLSRSVESRADKKPMLSDLRESGQIEQDADMVIFTYRPEYYGITEYQLDTTILPTDRLFIAIVGKHRNGGIGEVELTFHKEQIRVSNYGYQPFDNSNQNNTFVENIKNEASEKPLQSNTNIEQNDNFLNEGNVFYNNTNIDDVPF